MPNYWTCTQWLLKLRVLQPTLQSPCSASKRSHTIQQRFHLLQLKPDAVKQIKKKKKKREAVSGRNPEKHQQSWIKAENPSKVNEKESQEVESRPGKCGGTNGSTSLHYCSSPLVHIAVLSCLDHCSSLLMTPHVHSVTFYSFSTELPQCVFKKLGCPWWSSG